jgi:hypothetical protein
MIHVHETKDGKLTGSFIGYIDEKLAKEAIDNYRHWRDNSMQYKAFRDGNYDWHIVRFNDDDSVTFLY